MISAEAIVNDPLLGDGQFLALVFVPLLGLGLMVLVFLESLVAGYRVVRSDASIRHQVTGRWGYLLIRGAEAGTAIVGVLIVFATLPLLFAETTPAPAGVGLLLVLFVAGLGILFIGFVRSCAELFGMAPPPEFDYVVTPRVLNSDRHESEETATQSARPRLVREPKRGTEVSREVASNTECGRFTGAGFSTILTVGKTFTDSQVHY